jgi:beta-lactamase regulating signal transducer with metallopeptidase domain
MRILEILADSSVRMVVVAIAVWGMLRITRVRSSLACHRVWKSVLAAMLLMPLLAWFVPPLRVLRLPAAFPSVAETRTSAIPASTASEASVPSPQEGLRPSARSTAAKASVSNSSSQIWPEVLLAIYAGVAAILMVRILLGWVAMKRLVRNATPIDQPGVTGLLESGRVSSPLTCGILRPRIILPASWREWSDEKLRVVLLHERSHVRSGDPAVSLLARLNCALFWFHPLSWWLERKLFTLAEFTCDDIAVMAMGAPERYASILLEFADAVRRKGSRVSWQGSGIENGLRQRIDRLAEGYAPQFVPHLKSIVIALLSLAVIYVSAAIHGTPEVLSAGNIQAGKGELTHQSDQNWAARKDQFKPYSHNFPQIIQASDYPTVQAIESLYEKLQSPGAPNSRWSRIADGLQFEHGARMNTLSVSGDQVVIADRTFNDRNTATFFSTLIKTLSVFADRPDCHALRSFQLRTRAYLRRTIIEFACLPEVVTVESAANGPENSERLYVLDIVKDSESLLWPAYSLSGPPFSLMSAAEEALPASALAAIEKQLPGFRLTREDDYLPSLVSTVRGQLAFRKDFNLDGKPDWALVLIDERMREYGIYYLLNEGSKPKLIPLLTRKWKDASSTHPINTPMILKSPGDPGISERIYNSFKGDPAYYRSVPAIEVWTGVHHDETDHELEDISYCSTTWYFEKDQLKQFDACD